MAVRPYTGLDGKFLEACKSAGTIPTHRQYRKWLQKRGKAYRAVNS